ncbi:MAG: hypothetical protein ACP5F8_03575 [Candidatus Aenigmatarchaeota archaeon]
MRKVRIAKIIKNKISISAKYKLGGILNSYVIKNKTIEKIIEMENNVASKMFSK